MDGARRLPHGAALPLRLGLRQKRADAPRRERGGARALGRQRMPRIPRHGDDGSLRRHGNIRFPNRPWDMRRGLPARRPAFPRRPRVGARLARSRRERAAARLRPRHIQRARLRPAAAAHALHARAQRPRRGVMRRTWICFCSRATFTAGGSPRARCRRWSATSSAFSAAAKTCPAAKSRGGTRSSCATRTHRLCAASSTTTRSTSSRSPCFSAKSPPWPRATAAAPPTWCAPGTYGPRRAAPSRHARRGKRRSNSRATAASRCCASPKTSARLETTAPPTTTTKSRSRPNAAPCARSRRWRR